MSVGLVLSLIKLGLEVFQDVTRDKYLKQYLKLQEDYEDEMAKGLDDRSDLTISRMFADAERLAQLVVAEANKR